jgi:probable phosphoglycerate mutase
MQVLGNAQPLRFERNGPVWSIKPLMQQAVDDAAALA